MKLLIHLKGLYSIYECPKCKEGFKIGLFKDSILFLENAANYLKEHNDTF